MCSPQVLYGDEGSYKAVKVTAVLVSRGEHVVCQPLTNVSKENITSFRVTVNIETAPAKRP